MSRWTRTGVILLFFVSTSLQVSIEKIDVKSEDDEEVATEAPGLWEPDLENTIWKEMGFPVEPQDVSSEESGPPPEPPVPIDFGALNLTVIGDKDGFNRVAGRAACQCGRPYTRIVNGEKARHNDIPWTVALTRKGSFGIFGGPPRPFCGGTLINDRYILTASHCVDGQTEKGINVLVNEEDFLITTETVGGAKQYGVSKIIMNPGYSRRTVDNDVALIRLDTPIKLGPEGTVPVTPVCLPANNNHDFSGLAGTVAGWGTVKEGGSQSSNLQKVMVPIITNSVCNSAQTRYSGKITDSMLCAGNVQSGGKDACQGDSGGPLIIDNGTRKTLVGVVSWGYGCGQKKAPGVYARVAKFPDWILANTQDADWCSE